MQHVPRFSDTRVWTGRSLPTCPTNHTDQLRFVTLDSISTVYFPLITAKALRCLHPSHLACCVGKEASSNIVMNEEHVCSSLICVIMYALSTYIYIYNYIYTPIYDCVYRIYICISIIDIYIIMCLYMFTWFHDKDCVWEMPLTLELSELMYLNVNIDLVLCNPTGAFKEETAMGATTAVFWI